MHRTQNTPVRGPRDTQPGGPDVWPREGAEDRWAGWGRTVMVRGALRGSQALTETLEESALTLFSSCTLTSLRTFLVLGLAMTL